MIINILRTTHYRVIILIKLTFITAIARMQFAKNIILQNAAVMT